jgi:hypothetical protein
MDFISTEAESKKSDSGADADMIYLINAQGAVVDTIDVFDRFGKKECRLLR